MRDDVTGDGRADSESAAEDRPADAVRGRFVVTHADDDSAVLKAVDGGQVHTLATNPGVEADDIVEATLAPEPPMEVTWRVVDLESRRALSIERSPEPPTGPAYDLAADQPVGEVTRRERAGEGELHVLTLEPGSVADAAEEVAEDEATRTVAARVDARRVELRLDDEEGVLSVRYLP
ncbi:MAG: DUF5812 family protein [Haloglomus sp.]